jgi:hypothetical protein
VPAALRADPQDDPVPTGSALTWRGADPVGQPDTEYVGPQGAAGAVLP